MEESVIYEKKARMPEGTGVFGRLSGMFHLMQEAAGEHVEILGLGREALKPENLLWVLSRTLVEVRALPAAGQALRIRTWPNPQRHGLYLRQCRLLDEEGRCLLRAVSLWTLMDAASRTMRQTGLPEQSAQWREDEDLPMPKGLPEISGAEVWRHVAAAEELDGNGHVNNANYVRWLDRGMPASFAGKALRRFQINYLTELRLGDGILLQTREEDGTLLFQGLTEDGRRSFGAKAAFSGD